MHTKIKVPTFGVFFNEVYAKDSLKLPKVKTLKYYAYRHFKNISTETSKIENGEVPFLTTTVVLMKQQSGCSVCSHSEWQKIKCPKQRLKTMIFQLYRSGCCRFLGEPVKNLEAVNAIIKEYGYVHFVDTFR
jgi:hypothetical protein